jgi:hypothetical protein
MNAILQKDFQRLINDISEVKKVLKMLESHCTLWARTKEEKDISDFIQGIGKIETDLCLALDDLVVKNHSSKKTENNALKAIQHAFSYINDLFCDIKNVRTDLKRSYIHSDELETLEIDLARLKKNIFLALNYLQGERLGKIISETNEGSHVN